MKLRKQSVFYSALLLSLSSIGLQLMGFVYRIGLSRLGGPAVMGLYQLVMPAYAVVNSFSLTGLTLAVSRLSATASASGDLGTARGVVRTTQLLFLCLFALAALPITLGSGWIAERLLGDGRVEAALLLLLPCLFLTGFENIFKAFFHGLKRIYAPITSELVEQFLRLAAGLGFLYFAQPKDPGYATALIVLGMVASEVASVSILASFFTRWRRQSRGALGAAAPRRLPAQIAAIAIPVSAAGVVNNLLSSATVVIIPQRLVAFGIPAGQAMSSFGIMVGMTLPLLMLPTAFIHPLNTVLLPRLSQYSAAADAARIRRKAGKALQVTSLLVSFSLAIMLPLGGDLARWIYGQPSAGDHILPLAATALFTFYHITTGGILNGVGLQKYSSASVAVTGVCELALTWLLVAAFGIAGYAYACLGSEMIGVAINLVVLLRKTSIRFRWGNWFVSPFLCGAAAGCAAALARQRLLPLQPGGACLAAAVAVCAFTFLAALRLVGVRVLRYLKTIAE